MLRTIRPLTISFFLFFLTTFPLFAHDGEDGVESSAGLVPNSTILVVAILMGLLVVAALMSNEATFNLNNLQYGVVSLATMTAVVHILAGLNEFILLLNGLGYIALIAAIYLLPPFKSMQGILTWVLIAYTGVTIVLYFISHPWGYAHEGDFDRLGLATKAIEVALIGSIFISRRQVSQTDKLSTATT